jgi:murein DD-endopeptidase MepM/ murein hydrolase activator NlpD
MKSDYIVDDSASVRRLDARARRSVLLAVLFAVSVSGLLSRESTANRQKLALVEPAGSEAQLALPTANAPADLAVTLAEPLTAAPDFGEAEMPTESEWATVVVKPGQTISTLIENEGMLKYEWIELMSLGDDVKRLQSLRVGDKVLLRKDSENRLEELVFDLDELRTLQVRRVDGKLEPLVITAEVERVPAQASGTITASLFADGAKAGLSDSLIIEMANIFNYDIDFAQDLREGDHFSVIYEEVFKNGVKLRDGHILAAEFVNQSKVHRAFRYVHEDGKAGYYAPDGQSLRKAFMRTPVDFARISSGFNLKRKHPILNVIRAHKGVDYAAPSGTPVKASGDGKVLFIGVKGGYGKVIILQHGNRYTTLYGHLSNFRRGLRAGSKVGRGQVIGYVGKSGLATAPHLHYEFRINGVHKNPMSVVLPRANGLSKEQLARWRNENADLVARLDALSASQLAQASGTSPSRRLAR